MSSSLLHYFTPSQITDKTQETLFDHKRNAPVIYLKFNSPLLFWFWFVEWLVDLVTYLNICVPLTFSLCLSLSYTLSQRDSNHTWNR